MKRHFSLCAACDATIILVAVVWVLLPASLEAATNKFVLVGIGDIHQEDGTILYSAAGRVVTFFPNQRTETLTSPNGVVFDDSFPGNLLTFSTFEEARAAVVGEWVFRTAPTNQPQNLEEYRFTISLFEQSDVAISGPVVTPATGALVHSPFTIAWTPPSNSYGFGSAGIGASGMLVQPGILDVTFNEPVRPGARITFSTSHGESFPEFVSDPTQPPTNPTYELFPSFEYGRQVRIRLTPVPEPATSTILGVGLAVLPLLRSTRARRASY